MASHSGSGGGHHDRGSRIFDAGGRRPCCDAGGYVLVRLNRRSLPLSHDPARPLNVLATVRSLKIGQSGEWPAWVRHPTGDWIPGRLIAVRRSRQAVQLARKKLKQAASKKQHKVSKESLEAARYFFVWTTLTPSGSWSAAGPLAGLGLLRRAGPGGPARTRGSAPQLSSI